MRFAGQHLLLCREHAKVVPWVNSFIDKALGIKAMGDALTGVKRMFIPDWSNQPSLSPKRRYEGIKRS
jgi:hypothetical protein